MEIIKFDLDKLSSNINGFNCYILGRSYDLEENGASKDYQKALYYYNEGINKFNNPLCMYSLGISLLFGLGDVLDINEEKANELLIKAYPLIINIINNDELSNEERLYAKFVTGAYNYYGLGNIPKNVDKAFKIINECAQLGHIAAIYDLGANFYLNGVGTPKDMKKASYYLKIANDFGLPRAIKKYKEQGFNER